MIRSASVPTATNASHAAPFSASQSSSYRFNALALAMVVAEAKEIEDPDYDFALAAEKASKMLKAEDPAILGTLGLVLFKKGDIKKAVATQEKAVELGKEQGIEGLGGRLKEYRDADK